MANLADLHGKAVPDHPNLQYWGRNGFIRVRIVVPAELRKTLGQQLVKGLGTPLISEAVRRSHDWIGAFQRQIAGAKAGRDPSETAQRLIAWGTGTDRPQLVQQSRDPVGRELARNVVSEASALLAMQYGGSEFEQPEDRRPAIAELIARHFDNRREHISNVGALIDEIKGVLLSQPAPELAAKRAAVLTAVSAESIPLAGFPYEAGLVLWAASHGDSPPAPESVGVYGGHLRRFMVWAGTDDMGQVTEQHVIDYPDVLLTGSDSRPRCSNKTVNNHMASIRAVFRVAAKKRKIASDPTEGNIHKLTIKKNAMRDRKGFDRVEHARIVSEALRLGTDDPRRWLWLLGCSYGSRIGEFADAKVSAVRMVAGHLCYDINEEYRCHWNGKPIGLKTEGSPRILPLHPALVEFGFLDYVERVRCQHGPDAPLFPMLPVSQYGKRAKDASRQCMGWLRNKLAIDDPRLVFHSTRHTIKTFLRGRVNDQVHDRVTGHTDGSVSAEYGETEHAVLTEALSHIPLAA
jgi:integrase